ncbi:MAG: hypothetical protein NW208_08420 [Bryobacter sp.]|nr:hypothetical protein [Bryobacter sp.]
MQLHNKCHQLLLLLTLSIARPLSGQQPAALSGLDPVLLTRGEERAGLPELGRKHGEYTYQFASAATQSEFANDPERFAIQLDGACARMGANSGQGSPQRWTVYDGRIYIFASDGCKQGFLSNPRGHLETPEVALRNEPRALEFLEQSARALGLARLPKTYSEFTERQIEAGKISVELAWRAPQSIQSKTDYPGFGVYGDEIREAEGVYWDRGKAIPHRPTQFASARRGFWQHPLFVFFARGQSGFSAWVEKASESEVELGVFFAGGLRILTFDAKTHLLRQARFQTRGPNSMMGETVDVFSDWRKVDGLQVPFRRDSTFDGKPWAGRSRMLKSAIVEWR